METLTRSEKHAAILGNRFVGISTLNQPFLHAWCVVYESCHIWTNTRTLECTHAHTHTHKHTHNGRCNSCVDTFSLNHFYVSVMCRVCVSHITNVIESCNTYEWIHTRTHTSIAGNSCVGTFSPKNSACVMCRVCMSHVTRVIESPSRGTALLALFRSTVSACALCGVCVVCVWVMSHMWLSRVTHTNTHTHTHTNAAHTHVLSLSLPRTHSLSLFCMHTHTQQKTPKKKIGCGTCALWRRCWALLLRYTALLQGHSALLQRYRALLRRYRALLPRCWALLRRCGAL